MLLSNLTASAAACSAVLALKITVLPDPSSPAACYPTQSRCGTCLAPSPYPSGEPREMLALPFMIDAFVQGAQVDSEKEKRKGQLHFLASVFANLTVVSIILSWQKWTTSNGSPVSGWSHIFFDTTT